jgi:hypothetical protein
MSITPAGHTGRIEWRASSSAVFDTIYRVRDEISSIADRRRIRSKLRAGTITASLLRFSLAEPAVAGSARGR